MFRRDHFISKLCGIALILIGMVYTVSLGFIAVIMIPQFFVKSTPDNIRNIAFPILIIILLIFIAFAISFILSGVGVLRFKEWARKLSLWSLGLHIIFLIPVSVGTFRIGIEKIAIISVSISIFYLLFKRSIKEQFMKKGVKKGKEPGLGLD